MGNTTPYKVQLASLPEGKFERDFVCDKSLFADMQNCDITACDVKVRLLGERRGELYKLTFLIEGEVELPCDRCLETLTMPVDAEYMLNVRYGDEHDDSDDEVLILAPSETWVDVAPMIRDTILLEIPVRRVHPEGACNPEMEKYIARDNRDDE